jgi:two-component system response regulator RegX3
MASILLVDDEETLRIWLSYALRKAGHDVTEAEDALEALERLPVCTPDLILLDWMLPGLDGVTFCRKIREVSDVPVVMLTARGEVEDRVVGLRTGADDYVTKPFSAAELLARIEAVLRRSGRRSGAPTAPVAGRGAALTLPETGLTAAGPVRIDVDRHEVTVHGRRVELSPKEFALLHALVFYHGRVLTREELLQVVWGDDFMGDRKTLDVHIAWLRAKIEADHGEPRHIVTVRGVGFRFD